MTTVAVPAVQGINHLNTMRGTQPVESPKEKEELGWFAKWLKNEDKVCTDGKDDGSISFTEGLKSFGKGLIGIVKSAINHPVATALTIGAGVAVTVATGGAALPVLVAFGATVGAASIGYGAYKVATAKRDKDAKQAWETIGFGTFTFGTSVLGAKSALNAAGKAGVEGASSSGLNTLQATARCFKLTPQALKVSGNNILINAKATATGIKSYIGENNIIKAGSSELRDATPYMSKANDVKAYRFNPNGTPEQIVANNPHVVEYAPGKYGVLDKFATTDAKKVYHQIDTSKEQMIMIYNEAEKDFAVCAGDVFKGSYVEQATLKANGTRSYITPEKLEYGQIIDATKQAPGAFKEFPVGTKVETLEGTKVVGSGEVVALDHNGNPYITPLKNITKRNVPIDTDASRTVFAQVQSTLDNGFKIKPGMEKEFVDIIKKYEGDSFCSIGVKDMKKIIAGLEKLNTSGEMNLKGYAELAKTINEDLPGSFWSEAIKLYTRFGENANPTKTITVAYEYLQGVSSINGMSGKYRLPDNFTKYTPILGLNSVVSKNTDDKENNSIAISEEEEKIREFLVMQEKEINLEEERKKRERMLENFMSEKATEEKLENIKNQKN